MIDKNNFETIVLNKANISDFSEERNKLLEKSKATWILFLDKDEKITPSLKDEINSEIGKLNNNYVGYFIKRKIVFLGKTIGEDKVLRLAKKNYGKWKRSVHEIWEIKGATKTLKSYIIHNTADNLKDYIKKINFHSDLHALENKKEGKNVTLCKIVFYPIFKLFLNLFLGRGFVFSLMQALHSFLSWTKYYFLQV